jgi:hypothetical protein
VADDNTLWILLGVVLLVLALIRHGRHYFQSSVNKEPNLIQNSVDRGHDVLFYGGVGWTVPQTKKLNRYQEMFCLDDGRKTNWVKVHEDDIEPKNKFRCMVDKQDNPRIWIMSADRQRLVGEELHSISKLIAAVRDNGGSLEGDDSETWEKPIDQYSVAEIALHKAAKYREDAENHKQEVQKQIVLYDALRMKYDEHMRSCLEDRRQDREYVKDLAGKLKTQPKPSGAH